MVPWLELASHTTSFFSLCGGYSSACVSRQGLDVKYGEGGGRTPSQT
jgi:hypothetical protein